MLRKKPTGLALILLATVTSAPAEAPKLDSFYIIANHFSDALTGAGQTVSWQRLLDVAPVDDGVRVRLIRFTSVAGCKEKYVEAAERLLPGASVASISGVDLCAIDEKKVPSVLDHSRNKRAGVWEGDDLTLVAVCRDKMRVLDLGDSRYYNTTSLRSRDNALAQAMDMFVRVRDRAFGPYDPLPSTATQLTPEQQKLAEAVVTDLEGGRFKEGLGPAEGKYLITEPPTPSSVLSAQLVESDTLKFESYQPVRIPDMALLARVSSDVHLRLAVVPSTGVVTDVAVVSGPPLLATDAATAARTWRLTPGSSTSEQIDVTLRFQLRCEKY